MKRAAKNKQRESMELQLQDGRWVLISVDPLNGPNNEDLFVHIARDITEIKNREYEIISTQKAEAFSILSGGLAHDYNNLLAVIWGNISMLREDMTDAIQQNMFEEVEKACEQAKELTHQFITLSQTQLPQKGYHSITDILSIVIQQNVNPRRHSVSLDIQDDIPAIEANINMLTIAFKNIVCNAVDAMPTGGELEIRVEIQASENQDQKHEKQLAIFFKDSGEGIPACNMHNVFDPYFTTKEMGVQKGSGLGLAVSQAVIKKHGGKIKIDSALGQGATVVVTLPLLNLFTQGYSNTNISLSPNQPVILFMEDDPPLRKMCEQILYRLKCNVIAASNLTETIELYLQSVKKEIKVDLALMDQNETGDYSGITALKELRKCGYKNPAIVVTGSPNSPAINNFKKYGFDDKLLKPYTKKELEKKIIKAIGQW